MRPVIWKKRSIGGKNDACFVIAEAGTAHQGSEEAAFRLIDAAKNAGAECVKFQIVFADEIVHPMAGSISLPGGNIPIFERFRELERDIGFYTALKQYTDNRGLFFLCSVFGEKSATLYRKLDPGAVKIASPELNHFPLLETVSGWNCPVFLSSGVSLLSDIRKALSIVNRQAVLFHCITSYPAREEEYNISLLTRYRSLFRIPIGISDHSVDPLLVPGAAVLRGAAVIEKHITLSPEQGGLDDPIALTENNFGKMVEGIREFEGRTENEGMNYLISQYGKDRVDTVMGSGEKELAPGEAGNYLTTRRSIITTVPIRKGDLFSESNIALLRSEKNIKPGLSPDNWKLILGKKAAIDIPSGKGIDTSDIGS